MSPLVSSNITVCNRPHEAWLNIQITESKIPTRLNSNPNHHLNTGVLRTRPMCHQINGSVSWVSSTLCFHTSNPSLIPRWFEIFDQVSAPQLDWVGLEKLTMSQLLCFWIIISCHLSKFCLCWTSVNLNDPIGTRGDAGYFVHTSHIRHYYGHLAQSNIKSDVLICFQSM